MRLYRTPDGNVSVEDIGRLGPTSTHLVRYLGAAEWGSPFTFVCHLQRTYDDGEVSGALGAYTRDTRRALDWTFRDMGLQQIMFVRMNGRVRHKVLT